MNPRTLLDNLVSAIAEATDGGAGIIVGVGQTAAIVLVVIIGTRLARRQIVRGVTWTTRDQNVAALAANLAVAGIYILGATLVLGVFGASWSAMLTVIGVSTVALSLALQDLLKSYVAGIYLLLERPFAVGDWIRVKEVEGEVDGINLRTTLLRTKRGEEVTVPNATVFAEVVINRSAKRDDRTTVTVSKLSEPLADLPQLVTAALSRLDGASVQPPLIEIIRASDDGASVAVTIFHPPGEEISTRLLTALHEAFPAADHAVERT